MDRRKALLNMGKSLGYTVAAPTFLSFIQSCSKGDESAVWAPTFLTKDQGATLTYLVDALLPKTDTPSASDMNVHVFIDKFAAEVMDDKQQKLLKETLDKIAQTVGGEISQEAVQKVAVSIYKENTEGFPFAMRIRDLTIWGYKCNEYIGEQVLAYLPVPGQYVSCGDVQELSGGRAWSI
ncbi:gluconate 2-dehydrogenase subunit 3 family protein [Flammeovirgaceae bacterium SG7u.111]|nr:gluconate 2-dehydrogenase subunit 3 family protein [Flammeovirgaceae bacterium SG7u.132]WPO36036.1 gluconate 2-dehydrogenase subunit 3 family protein [Flammeovirgaceae bacterium SG7u.111]